MADKFCGAFVAGKKIPLTALLSGGYKDLKFNMPSKYTNISTHIIVSYTHSFNINSSSFSFCCVE